MGRFESGIQDRTVAMLEKLGAWVRVKHGTQFGRVGDPDVYGCLPDPNGKCALFFGFEIKNEDGELSAMQVHTLRQLAEMHAICGAIQSPEEAKALIDEGLYGQRRKA